MSPFGLTYLLVCPEGLAPNAPRAACPFLLNPADWSSRARGWSDATNASSSEDDDITCTWGIFCRCGYAKLNDRDFCSSSFECVPSRAASNWTLSEGKTTQNCSELRVFRPIGRPGGRPFQPQLWGYRHITCPCGVYCPWGSYYAGLRRVCRGTVQCAPCR